ncbi:unnamed protein product [Discula destructiva]
MATYQSPTSSHDRVHHRLSHHDDGDGHADHELIDPDTVGVEVLVEHLLAAKRALSSVTLVQRADALSTHARQLHEESVILDTQTAFLKRGIADQAKLLKRVQRSMIRTYDSSHEELFGHLIPNMDHVGEELTKTIDKLKKIQVDPVIGPPGEENPRYLFDFVSEEQVNIMVADLKDAIHQAHRARDSFKEEIQRFETETNELTATLSPMSTPPTKLPTGPDHPEHASMLELFASMQGHSHDMATGLNSLNTHYDACIDAVLLTEGGADLACRKAAEDSVDATNPVSISGMMPEQGAELDEPEISRAEAVTRVIKDAQLVELVVADLHEDLQKVELAFNFLKDQSDRIQGAYGAVAQAFRQLEGIGSRLTGYIGAANSFVEHWNEEKAVIFDTLSDMEGLQHYWERYADAYDSLILEVERRRAVEEKMETIWRKAKDQVDKLVHQDWVDREAFTKEVGDYIPVDLWERMSGPLQKWQVVRAPLDERAALPALASGEMPQQEEGSAAVLNPGVVDGALERLGVASSGRR